jgi:hypothetical protein
MKTLLRALCALGFVCLAAAQAPRFSFNPLTGQFDISGDANWGVVGAGVLASRPATCTANRDMYICNGTGCTSGQRIHYCVATNSWEAQGAAGGTGITTLNTLIAATQTLANANDTNVTLSISSVTSTHTFTLGWAGALAKARQFAATAYTDQANVFTAGSKQTTSQSATTAGFNLGALAADPSAPAQGDVWITSDILKMRIAAATKSVAFTDSALSGFTGTTSKAQQHAATVYNDQANVLTGDLTINSPGNLLARSAAATAPIKNVSSLPGTCVIGEYVYLTTAATAGQNTYGCTSTNVWTLQGDGGAGGGATDLSGLTDLRTTATSTIVTTAAGAVHVNGTQYAGVSSTITKTAGTDSGTFRVGFDYNAGSPVLRCYYGAGITITNYTVSAGFSGSTCTSSGAFPANVVPLSSVVITTGSFGTPVDLRAMFGIDVYTPGTGITITSNAVAINPAAYPAVTGAFDMSSATQVVERKQASDPATCTVGETVYNTTVNALKLCTAVNTWTSLAAGGTVTSVDASGGVQTVSGSPITATGTIRGASLVNAQVGTTYTVVDGDRAKLVTHSNAAAIATTLPVAGGGGTFVSGWYYYTENRGAGTVTITPTTSTIDGATTLALTTNQGAIIMSDGTNYFTMRGVGGGASSGPPAPFSGDYYVFSVVPCNNPAINSVVPAPISWFFVAGTGSPTLSCAAAANGVLMDGLTLNTSGVSGNDAAMRADGFQTDWLATTKLWTVKHSFSLGSITTVSFIIGLTSLGSQTPTNGVLVRFDTNLSDANFVTCIANAGTTTCATDVETVDTAIHTVQWQKVSSTTITGTWNSGSVYTFDTRANGSGCTAGTKTICSATFNTANSIMPNLYMTTRSAVARSATMNYWEIQKQR